FEAVVVKGVGADYRWHHFEEFLKEGKLPGYSDEKRNSTEVLLSEYMANRLHFEVGDKAVIYFMNAEEQERTRLVAFDVVGIFNSGFREFDKTFVIADLSQIQRLNKWDSDQVGGFEVFIKDFKKIESVGKKVYHQIDSTLDAQTIIQQYP